MISKAGVCVVRLKSTSEALIQSDARSDASTAAFQPLTQVSNTAATTGLTSGFGMGPGRTLSLWPA
jgi:hypothetical protein